MTLYFLDHLLVGLIVLILPVADYFNLRRNAALILDGQTERRAKVYKRLIWEEWIGAFAIVALWYGAGRGAAQLGMVPRFEGLAWVGYALTLVVCGLLLLHGRSIIGNPDQYASLREQIGELSFMIPRTGSELKMFNVLSVTAGICEEIIFRGFLTTYAMALLGIPLWIALVLSSLAFGLAHMYQGVQGMLRAGLTGGALALLYALSGSLWAPMLAHAVIDLMSCRVSYHAFRGHESTQGS